MVYHNRYIQLINLLEMRLELVFIQIQVSVMRRHLNTAESEFLYTPFQFFQAAFAAPRWHNCHSRKPARILLKLVCNRVVQFLAGFQIKPLLPAGHPQHTLVNPIFVHLLDL